MSFAEIKKAVNSNLNIPLDELMKSGVIPMVKSVQRGNFEMSATTFVVINISEVNPDKCVVITTGSDGSDTQSGITGITFSNNSLTFTTYNSYGGSSSYLKGTWQVIEFY